LPSGTGEPYTILLPPPNVTGTLHMGHAFQQTLMDRFPRMTQLASSYDPLRPTSTRPGRRPATSPSGTGEHHPAAAAERDRQGHAFNRPSWMR
jgi:hypothetical protein